MKSISDKSRCHSITLLQLGQTATEICVSTINSKLHSRHIHTVTAIVFQLCKTQIKHRLSEKLTFVQIEMFQIIKVSRSEMNLKLLRLEMFVYHCTPDPNSFQTICAIKNLTLTEEFLNICLFIFYPNHGLIAIWTLDVIAGIHCCYWHVAVLAVPSWHQT